MLAHHLRVDRSRLETQLPTQDLPQSRRVEHGARPEDALQRQARGLRRHLGQHIDRVGHDEQQSPQPGELARDVANHADIVVQQIEARLPRTTAPTRGDDHRVEILHLVHAGGSHSGRGIERAPVPQVERFPLGEPGLGIAHQKLRHEVRVQRGDGHAAADPAHSDYSDTHRCGA